ncbi:hypothetical protein GCM10010207_83940 [Streptomyces atratus]|nr:hypothetical protein GCM10010207_83940 [Streptomyces atratus]
MNTGEVQVVAAEAGTVVTVSRPPAVASTTAVAAAVVVRLAGFMKIMTREEWRRLYRRTARTPGGHHRR